MNLVMSITCLKHASSALMMKTKILRLFYKVLCDWSFASLLTPSAPDPQLQLVLCASTTLS